MKETAEKADPGNVGEKLKTIVDINPEAETVSEEDLEAAGVLFDKIAAEQRQREKDAEAEAEQRQLQEEAEAEELERQREEDEHDADIERAADQRAAYYEER